MWRTTMRPAPWLRRYTLFQSTSSMWRTTGQPVVQALVRHRFQSTSSMWRTTSWVSACAWAMSYFNPRPPCGGRPFLPLQQRRQCHFNPRPPCGGRLSLILLPKPGSEFQSTSSMWRTTKSLFLLQRLGMISIHVLRAEDDFGNLRLSTLLL